MGKRKNYLLGAAAGGLAAVGMTVVLRKRQSVKNTYGDVEVGVVAKKRNYSFSHAKTTLRNFKEQFSTFKNEGIPAVKSTISDISSLVKTFQKDIQPHLSQIKEDLEELEKTKEKLQTEMNEPAPK